jgi:hypothetical protein
MTKIAELIERLEKATGPALVLDGEIWCAVYGYEFVMWDGAGCVYRDPNAPKWDAGIKHAQASTVRPYTASIDSAVALAVKLLDIGAIDIEVSYRSVGGKPHGRAEICGPDVDESAIGPTPAIALCICILSALRAKEGAPNE